MGKSEVDPGFSNVDRNQIKARIVISIFNMKKIVPGLRMKKNWIGFSALFGFVPQLIRLF